MGQLEDMALFLRVVEAGGISRAAEQLNIAKSAVSRRLSDLEQRLGVQLLQRTTRKMSLTELGHNYFHRARAIIDEVSALDSDTSGKAAELSGTLRLTMPLSFGLLHLTQLINEFVEQHPKLNLQIDFSDRQVDLVGEGYELGIRIAELKDSSLQARQLTTIRHVICASPEYLQQYPEIKQHQDLHRHRFLHYGLSKQVTLVLADQQQHIHQLSLESQINSNNGDFLKDMAVNGRGLLAIPTFLVYRELRDGRLRQVLPRYSLPDSHAYAVYPRTRFLSAQCRLLIDFLVERLGEKPYWDEGLRL